MRLLLDSHALVFALENPTRLGPQADVALRDKTNVLLLSAATIWELAIKVGIGKLSLNQPYRGWMAKAIGDLGVSVLPITVENSPVPATLPNHHRDPFDRMLAAQAIVEQVPIVSSDPIFERYGATRVW